MAVQSTQVNSSLTLKYKDGVDAKGVDVIKTKKFSNIKITADDQGLMDVAAAFNPLMKYPISQVLRSNENILINA